MREEIIETIRATLGMRSGQIREDSLLEKVVKDSIDLVELIAVLSDQYRMRIEPSKMNHIKTIGDVINYVIENMGTGDGKEPIEAF